MRSRLDIEVASPGDSAWQQLETRLLVDGEDVVRKVFDTGPGADPDSLLGPDSPLLAASGPVTVRVDEADCTWECCGGIEARVRRDGDEIAWDLWRTTDELRFGEFRFDAGQCEAELLRADRERDWEWPGRTVARLASAALRARPGILGEWDSGLDFASCQPSEHLVVWVAITSPPRAAGGPRQEDGPMSGHTQYWLKFPVSDEPAQVQAERIADNLQASDPRPGADRRWDYPANRP